MPQMTASTARRCNARSAICASVNFVGLLSWDRRFGEWTTNIPTAASAAVKSVRLRMSDSQRSDDLEASNIERPATRLILRQSLEIGTYSENVFTVRASPG